MIYRNIKNKNEWYVNAHDALKRGDDVEKFKGSKWEPYLAKIYEEEIAKKELLIEKCKKKK